MKKREREAGVREREREGGERGERRERERERERQGEYVNREIKEKSRKNRCVEIVCLQ